jgi:hypothetical protein
MGPAAEGGTGYQRFLFTAENAKSAEKKNLKSKMKNAKWKPRFFIKILGILGALRELCGEI